MDPNKGYWHRQFYFLSSLGIFYLILIALFAIPLLGTFVVILIKGALDLRYVIIAAGCVTMGILIWLAVKFVKRGWQHFRHDGTLVGQEVRRNLRLGKPVEISIFNGLFKFSCGTPHAAPPLALSQENRQMLPLPDGHTGSLTILDQLQHLSELKETGAINEDEFNILKAMLIEPYGPACQREENNQE